MNVNTRIRRLTEAYSTEQLHDVLSNAGIAGPHSFIRGLDANYDRDVLIGQWLRPLTAADDLRFVVHVDHSEVWVLAERLPWDSEFFGLGMARLNAVVRPGRTAATRDDGREMAQALTAVADLFKQQRIDYVFAAVSPADLPLIRAISANGFELIETRCHYHRALSGPPAQRYATRLARPEDVPSLARAARVMVNSYDRFHADIAIAPAAADRLMERWVEASIMDGFADATIVPDEPEPEAFCTARYHRQHWEGWKLRLAQPVLSAVSPRHKGWYVRIISELDEHLRQIGAEHSFLITQITNNAVIRSWEKLGYQFGKGEHIFRRLL